LLKIVKKPKKRKNKLSTREKFKSAIKWSFAQSYPHYPQKKALGVWIIFVKKRTGVLWTSDKNRRMSKKMLTIK